MGDFFRPATNPIARKDHICVGCYTRIVKGEVYNHQTGVYDGRWFANKLHQECADSLSSDSDGGWYEFTPGDLDPPQRESK